MSGLEFSRNQKLALVALIGAIIIGLSILYARNSMGAASDGVEVREPGLGTRVIASDSDQVPSAGDTGGKVVFHVAGYVNKPGVYSLPEGQRVIDAINAAGGALAGADTQSLNLAAKIEDGQRIYVPPAQMARGVILMPGGIATHSASRPPAPTPASTARSSPSSGSGKLRTPGEGVVSINSADIGELQRLPGVGPSTAQKILDYRAQIGRFSSTEQIMDVKGIGPKKYEKMRPFLSL